MGKVLYFEGAGCVPCNDVENCRIRTAFTNDKGKKMYIEFISGCRRFYVGNKLKSEDGYLWCDCCFYITEDPEVDDENKNRHECERNPYTGGVWKYTKKNILTFINQYCDCSFDDIVILDNLAGFRVFTGLHTQTKKDFNFGDRFEYNQELTEKRIAIVEEKKKQFSDAFNQRYDNTSYYIRDGRLIARINVSKQAMVAAGYDPENREMILD